VFQCDQGDKHIPPRATGHLKTSPFLVPRLAHNSGSAPKGTVCPVYLILGMIFFFPLTNGITLSKLSNL